MKFALAGMLIALLLFVLTDCRNDKGRQQTIRLEFIDEIDIPQYRIYRIDGCQYVWLRHNGEFAHKGNCDNPIHIYNKLEK